MIAVKYINKICLCKFKAIDKVGVKNEPAMIKGTATIIKNRDCLHWNSKKGPLWIRKDSSKKYLPRETHIIIKERSLTGKAT